MELYRVHSSWAGLDRNKVERKQFTVDAAIALGQKKLDKNIVFSGDGRFSKEILKNNPIIYSKERTKIG